ncbi:uncharacterized protein LOC143459893 [Clavelina lepadiformis]|uniref:uncharacterized protein LOC143459893 n=1 Tax=Clavelina lepadiformis TaxID=159417 RepID=UPI0040419D3A
MAQTEPIELIQLPHNKKQQEEIYSQGHSENVVKTPRTQSESSDDERLLSDSDQFECYRKFFNTIRCSEISCRGVSLAWKGPFQHQKGLIIIGGILLFLAVASLSAVFTSISYRSGLKVTERCPMLNLTDGLNVQCTNANKMESVCYFACTNGKKLSGGTHSVCNHSNLWSSEIPYCTIRDCPSLTLPDDMEIKCSNDNKVGSTCTFACTGDKIIEGKTYTSCNESNHWTSAPPRCCISWKSLMDDLSVIPFTTLKVDYAEAHINCNVKLIFNNFEIKYECTCKDVLIDHSQTCHYWNSPLGSCKHALSFLVRDMNKIDPDRFPVPCDPENMDKRCDRSLDK